jgi:cellulose synthase/poly-beta-1,6-N-acetylglucosamine synthase-like glycosyltransferase
VGSVLDLDCRKGGRNFLPSTRLEIGIRWCLCLCVRYGFLFLFSFLFNFFLLFFILFSASFQKSIGWSSGRTVRPFLVSTVYGRVGKGREGSCLEGWNFVGED